MIKNSEIVFETKIRAPYPYHAILHHLPTGMEIEQASNESEDMAKMRCVRELNWRLAHWDEYKRSAVCKDY